MAHNEVEKSFYVHRIIWEITNGDIPEGMVVNHIDNNGLNNKLLNLELCTVSENNRRTLVHTGNGIRKDNKLKVSGVKIMIVGNCTYTVARIRYNKTLYEKVFSHIKYDVEESIMLATEWRNNKITEFNELGAGFTKPIELIVS